MFQDEYKAEAMQACPEDFLKVEIFARSNLQGLVMPHHIRFEYQGELYQFRITRVLEQTLASARKSPIPQAGGIRYTVIFNDKVHVLYRVADTHWFLSLKERY